jgi:archaellum component FlaG (FlaF/FlaG flagellin family)
MFNKTLAASLVAVFTANAAFAGDCVTKERKSDAKDVDVNIKVKNDTDEIITVSIWKGTSTEKKTLFSDEVSVPIDGKEGKTDQNVTNATFYFSAKRPGSDTEAQCSFWVNESHTTTSVFGKDTFSNIDDFECKSKGDFKVSCDKGFDQNKYRWNVTYSLE